MSEPLVRLIASALLLFAPACADDSKEAEIACQQRLVDVPFTVRGAKAEAGKGAIASNFARLSQGYAEMSLDGCTGDQADRAGSLSRLARRLADSGDVAERAREGPPDIRQSEAFMAFMVDVERFEGVRSRLREELDDMKGKKP